MVDVVLKGVRVLYRINKDEGNESMPLLPFRKDVVNAIFLKYWADHYRAVQEFEISHQMFAMMTQNITRCNMNTDVFRNFQASKMECFADTVNG